MTRRTCTDARRRSARRVGDDVPEPTLDCICSGTSEASIQIRGNSPSRAKQTTHSWLDSENCTTTACAQPRYVLTVGIKAQHRGHDSATRCTRNTESQARSASVSGMPRFEARQERQRMPL